MAGRTSARRRRRPNQGRSPDILNRRRRRGLCACGYPKSAAIREDPRMTEDRPASREAIFPTFFMAGFECSTFVWKDGQRKDYGQITGHDRHFEDDYRRMLELGIGVVREAIRWPIVDKGNNQYDWSSIDPLIEVMNASRITAIWDLCHYGFPDGCDPF